MTQITFTLKDESKLSLILNWLRNQDTVRDIATTPIQLTPKQLEMKNDLAESLHEVELHQQGKIKLKTWAELRTELEKITKGDKSIDPSDLFGMWQDNPRSIETIRKKAIKHSYL